MEFEQIKDTLMAEVDTGLKYAQSLDKTAEFEIYLLYRSISNVSINQGIVEATDGVVAGNAVRVAKNRRVSFSSSSGVSVDRIRRSIDEALESLNTVSVEDERFVNFCDSKSPGKEGIFAKEILDLSTDDLVESANRMIADARAVDERILGQAGCQVIWNGLAIGNTRGLLQASRSAHNSCSIYAMAIDGEERRQGWEEVISRERPFDIEGLGKRAAEKALALLGAKKLGKTLTLPTIWIPIAAAGYLLASLGQSVMGATVVEKLSPLMNKIGEKIASSKFTLTDDGQNPKSIGTQAIDAEGHPQGRTTIIDHGVLKDFLFDTYYGRIFGSGSTGNCARGGGPFGATLPYEVAPSIAPTSFEVEPGTKSEEDLIASIDGQAILILDIPIGIFHSDVSTGEFSSVASSAMLIDKGERRNALQPVSIAGSFYKGLSQLREIGSNLEITPFGVTVPSLIIDGFSVVG